MSRLTLHALWLTLACLLMAFCSLSHGAIAISGQQIWQALVGQAPANVTLILFDWRLPRVAIALLVGASLSISGAIFQSLLRNPLGSPDVLGFNVGAYSGVLLALTLLPWGIEGMTAAALLGGVLTAGLVYLLAWRNGVDTFRLIMVGIGVRALLMALNSWLVISASLDAALTAGVWSAGTLNGLTWAKTPPVALVLLTALIATLLLARRMRLLEMGDDTAAALGVPVESSRRWLMLTSVVLTAAATALVGPISFIALVGPQIARRLCPGSRGVLTLSALCGALLLIAADYAAQHLFLPWQLPVGVVTVSIGGFYLFILLMRETKGR